MIPSGRGLHSSRCTRLNCEVLCIAQQCVLFTIQLLQVRERGHSAWTKSDAISQALHVLRNLFSRIQLGSFTPDEVTVNPGAVSRTAVLAHYAANKPQNCNHLSHT